MSLPVQRRWLLLGGLLTATLAAAAWVHERDASDDELVAVAERPQARERQRRAAAPPPEAAPARVARNEPPRNDVPQVRLDRLDARQLGDATRDPFAPPVKRVQRAAPKPAPVVVARPAPPPPPSAPPLPFKYMGKLASSDGVSVFLIHGDRNLVAHEGETIASKYRVDRIGETTMALTYLPLNQQQTLNFGEGR